VIMLLSIATSVAYLRLLRDRVGEGAR
jgi:hypothetical protein